MSDTEIAVGQIWRRKSGRLFEIVASRTGEWDDWIWKGIDYKGSGVSYGIFIRQRCELVLDPLAAEKGTDQ